GGSGSRCPSDYRCGAGHSNIGLLTRDLAHQRDDVAAAVDRKANIDLNPLRGKVAVGRQDDFAALQNGGNFIGAKASDATSVIALGIGPDRCGECPPMAVSISAGSA